MYDVMFDMLDWLYEPEFSLWEMAVLAWAMYKLGKAYGG